MIGILTKFRAWRKKNKRCKVCKEEMMKCGFGSVGGLTGNARWECRNKKCKSNEAKR